MDETPQLSAQKIVAFYSALVSSLPPEVVGNLTLMYAKRLLAPVFEHITVNTYDGTDPQKIAKAIDKALEALDRLEEP